MASRNSTKALLTIFMALALMLLPRAAASFEKQVNSKTTGTAPTAYANYVNGSRTFDITPDPTHFHHQFSFVLYSENATGNGTNAYPSVDVNGTIEVEVDDGSGFFKKTTISWPDPDNATAMNLEGWFTRIRFRIADGHPLTTGAVGWFVMPYYKGGR